MQTKEWIREATRGETRHWLAVRLLVCKRRLQGKLENKVEACKEGKLEVGGSVRSAIAGQDAAKGRPVAIAT